MIDEHEQPPDPAEALVDGHGRRARQSIDTRCPRCGAGPEKRVKSGMANPHPVCVCGYEFFEEAWRE